VLEYRSVEIDTRKKVVAIRVFAVVAFTTGNECTCCNTSVTIWKGNAYWRKARSALKLPESNWVVVIEYESNVFLRHDRCK